MVNITGYKIRGEPCYSSSPEPSLIYIDVRFPTSLTGDGTDAMYVLLVILDILELTGYRNTECDYSSAYITLLSDSDLVGHGMTFTIGRGNDIVRPSTCLVSKVTYISPGL